MSKFFRSMSGREMVKVLLKIGFNEVSQHGSHIKMKHFSKSGTQIIIVPDHKELTPGVFRNILKTAELSVDKLDELR